jgi:uncharacterized protein (TIGR00369 family)
VTTAHLAAMTGLEQLRWEAQLPADSPNIRRLIGMRFHEIEHGRVVMSLKSGPDFANPQGTVHGGIAATLLDSVMGCADHSTLPAGAAYTTLEIKVNYVRAVQTDGHKLSAAGELVHSGRRIATAEGRVLNEDGKLIAHGTTTCLILEAAS